MFAEIVKRENQSRVIEESICSVQDQLRVTLSSLQEAVGAIQYRLVQEREEMLYEVWLLVLLLQP